MALIPATPDGRPTVNIGMLGYGFMGKAHSNAFKTMPYIFWPDGARPRLKAIAGRTEDKVAEAATRYGFETYSTDWHDLLTDPEIQVFDNVGPDPEHFGPTMAAIKAGKHVVCEKPLALSAQEATQLHDAAVEANVKHLTCFNYRFVPAVRLAYEMISNGELGEIYTSSFRYAQEWRTDPDAALPTSAGALSVIGCHAIDQARLLVGDITAVSAVVSNPVSSADRGEPVDAVTSIAEFHGGATGTISATLIAPGRRNRLSWEINGSKGSICWDLENLNVLRVYRRGGSTAEGFAEVIVCEADHPLVGPWWPSGHVLGWEHSHINMLADFVRAVAEDSPLTPTAATFADGAKAALVADAITESAVKGVRTAVPELPGTSTGS
jgi:predicted dehydrogenase